MQSIIDDHSPSLTEKQKSVIETEIDKVVSKMKARDEVPESCYNAIQSPLKALYTSTMAKDDKSIKHTLAFSSLINSLQSKFSTLKNNSEIDFCIAKIGLLT